MVRNISLDYFSPAPTRRYHVYRIGSSKVSQSLHTHDYYQICYVTRGRILHCYNDEDAGSIELVFGDAFIVPPGFVHKVVFPDPDSEIYSLSFEEAIFPEASYLSNFFRFMTSIKLDSAASEHIDTRMKVSLNEDRRFIMKALLDSLMRESASECPPELTSAESLIASVMCILSQAYFLDGSRRGTMPMIAVYSSSMQECIDYIDRRFTSRITLSELTRRTAISGTNFNILFRQFTGTSLKKYITNKRIEYASTLVASSELPMHEISRMAGYDDFSTFYRNFKKVTGSTPTEYRNAER